MPSPGQWRRRPARAGYSIAVLLLCATALSARPAQAQDETRAEIAMQNQILELRQDIDSLRAQMAAGGNSGGSSLPAPPPSSDGGSSPALNGDISAQLLDRVSRLEDENRSLRGAVDELRNSLQQQNADLSKQISDLAFRVQTLESGTAAPATPSGDPSSAPGPAAPASAAPASAAPPLRLPAGPPSKATTLQAGYAALARRDYDTAEATARANLHGVRGYDAQFLLAQSLAGQHNYQQAALAYDDVYTKQRAGAHAPDALVGLAGSLASLGDKPAACATLNKLRAEFPALRPDVKASAGAVSRRAACH